MVPVGSPLPNELQAQQLSCMDEKHGILYAIFYDETKNAPMFTGISLTTGAIVSSVPVPFAESSFIGVGQFMAWDPLSAQLLAGGQVANQSHIIGWVNPTTGAWTHLSTVPSTYLDVLGGAVTFSETMGDLFFQLGTNTSINIFSLNVKTGALKQFDQSYTDGHNLETMDFDVVSGNVYGLGILPSGNTFERTIVVLYPQNMTMAVVGKVEKYGIESGGIAALAVGQSLFWIAQKTGAAPADPFYLIQNSLKDASVISVSAELCTSDPTCPWSLEYLNAKF